MTHIFDPVNVPNTFHIIVFLGSFTDYVAPQCGTSQRMRHKTNWPVKDKSAS